ncbi:ComEC/Rec2 family competence protein [Subtercola endophyticus]|uniref:ComEC/Rec2 family competence protein n=1 Tax=Subtercola endophyticus TaxID=2895559 RepID=UPI001E5F4AAB|nr:ComEC/Rec2 family competence protein [Subtercola endophyticus]UFS60757.1 ComEC/Rec2 family competence protein [Subtercola endophyticus]
MTIAGSLAVSMAAAAVALASIVSQVPAREPPALRALDGHSVTTELIVGSAPVEVDAEGFSGPESSVRFTATVTRVTAAGRETELRMPVLVFLARTPSTAAAATSPGTAQPLQIGSQLRLTGTLKATDPGESVVYLLFASGAPQVLDRAPWYLDWANGLRTHFRDSLAGLPGDGAELAPGLAIGDVSLVSDDLNAAMISSGLSHLTAVSGANCAVVVAAIMLCGGAIGLSRRWRIVVSIAVMTAFVVLVTPTPSVLRAAIMAAIVLITLGSGRAPRGLPALALATMVMLIADPWLSRSYGLALSVLATGGLLLLTRPLQRGLARWLPARLALVVAVPLAAQLACQPVLVLLAPSISTYSVVANLLAEPAAPVATVIGLISCLAGAVAPPLAPIGAWLTWAPASWIAGVATFFEAAPAASIPWPGGALGVALIVVLTVSALLAVFLRESSASRARRMRQTRPLRLRPRGGRALAVVDRLRRWLGTRVRRRPRSGSAERARLSPVQWIRLASGGVVALTITVYAGAGLGSVLHGQAAWPPDWHIAACDIGQGDAVVLRDPATGKIALIDVGPDPALLTTCLHRLAITTIDLLILTHYDLDHVGGLSAVLGHVVTAMLGPPEDGKDAAMASSLSTRGADVRHPTRGDSGTLGTVAWHVLWPEAGTELRGNDACVTVEFTGAITSLFLGDLGEDSQGMVMAANALHHVDVVKVAHHGSADQSEALYQAISATVGIISVGMNNRYGHPTDRLLGILARAQTIAYRTDLLGMIVLTPTAAGIDVWSDGAARVEKKK